MPGAGLPHPPSTPQVNRLILEFAGSTCGVQVIHTVVEETAAQGLKDLGTVMKTVMARLAGRPVDGKRASELVRGQLQ